MEMEQQSELPPSREAPKDRSATASSAPVLAELLRRALAELKASAVGITRATGGPPRYFTRSAVAARFFEDICNTGLESLKEQTQARSGVFGTNRVKGDMQGPIRGRLIAVSLRSAKGMPMGILIATRLIEEPKFGAPESQKLLSLAPEFAAALVPVPSRTTPAAVPVLEAGKGVSGLSVDLHTVPTPLSISFGVAMIPPTEGGLGHALAAAEAACNAAKDRGSAARHAERPALEGPLSGEPRRRQ